MRLRSETIAAIAAVEAGLATARARRGADVVRAKGHLDIVTDTDLATEDAIRAVLREQTPQCGIVGEERGGELADQRACWFVDPICGTQNFAAGLPLYATNIALVEDNRLTVAVVGDGSSALVYVAELGRGAHIVGTAGSLRATASSNLIALDPGKARDSSPRFRAIFDRTARTDRWGMRVLGTSLALAYLASGSLAAVINLDLDHMLHVGAGCLLAGEAGASVTDIDGDAWTVNSRSVLAAATPELHRELLALVRQ